MWCWGQSASYAAAALVAAAAVALVARFNQFEMI